MLTQKDLSEIEQLIREEIKYLPTKDEFYGKMDEVMVELKTIREEQTAISDKHSEHTDTLENHEERIVKLEEASSVI